MSAPAPLEVLMNTLVESGVDQNKVSELKESFNENQIELFLEKLSAFDELDSLIDDTTEPSEQSNQLIDLVCDLIISK
jgi:hypothetical protein